MPLSQMHQRAYARAAGTYDTAPPQVHELPLDSALNTASPLKSNSICTNSLKIHCSTKQHKFLPKHTILRLLRPSPEAEPRAAPAARAAWATRVRLARPVPTATPERTGSPEARDRPEPTRRLRRPQRPTSASTAPLDRPVPPEDRDPLEPRATPEDLETMPDLAARDLLDLPALLDLLETLEPLVRLEDLDPMDRLWTCRELPAPLDLLDLPDLLAPLATPAHPEARSPDLPVPLETPDRTATPETRELLATRDPPDRRAAEEAATTARLRVRRPDTRRVSVGHRDLSALPESHYVGSMLLPWLRARLRRRVRLLRQNNKAFYTEVL